MAAVQAPMNAAAASTLMPLTSLPLTSPLFGAPSAMIVSVIGVSQARLSPSAAPVAKVGSARANVAAFAEAMSDSQRAGSLTAKVFENSNLQPENDGGVAAASMDQIPSAFAAKPSLHAPVAPSFSAIAPISEPAASPASTVAGLRRAFAEQPRAELARTIARAKRRTPLELRAALREELEERLAGVPRLQRHLMALDADGDGTVTMAENYGTLRELGMPVWKALLIGVSSQFAIVVSAGRVGWFSIAVDGGPDGLHRAVDTGAMAPETDLNKKLDEFMAEDLDRDGWITMEDVGRLIDKRADSSDAGTVKKAFVKVANKAEFSALFDLVGGRMSREDLRDFYHSSLFFGLLPPRELAGRLVGLRSRGR